MRPGGLAPVVTKSEASTEPSISQRGREESEGAIERSFQAEPPRPPCSPASRIGPCLLFAAILLAGIQPLSAQFNTGTYTGNGNDARAITGVGFSPDVVFVEREDSESTVVRTVTMSGDISKPLAEGADPSADLIESLDADGFTVGTDVMVNNNGSTYHWIALKNVTGQVDEGSYSGDGNDDRSITGVGFQPDYVVVMGAGTGKAAGNGIQRFSSQTGDASFEFDAQEEKSGLIQAFESDGFQVGKSDDVNKNGETYHYLAFKAVAGKVNVASYSGDGADNRNITGVGFQPDWVILKSSDKKDGLHRPSSISGGSDLTLRFTDTSSLSNAIQALQSDGFQVGSDDRSNANGKTFFWAAISGVGFSLSESGSYTEVDESGTTDTFTVVLDSQPASNVVFTVSSGDTGEATVSPPSLTFTNANWSTAQTVTVTGVDDVIVDGHQSVTVTVSVDDGNSDDAYDPLADQKVSVWATDDDSGPVALNSVQSGTTTLTTTSKTVTITSVNTSKAFLVFGVSLSENQPATGQISGQITNATTLTFERWTAGGSVTIEWHVVEFTGGVSVQRGAANYTSPGDATLNETLTGINTAKSFPIVSYRSSETNYDRNDWVKAKITSPTNLELDMYETVSGAFAEWQVVEYMDAGIQKGDVSFGSGDASQTASISSVDTGKSWLVHSYKAHTGTTANIGQKLIRGRMTNATTLTFDRNNTGAIADVTWYVVEFSDLTTVQHNSQSFTTSETQKDVTITTVDTGEAIGAGGHSMRAGRSAYSADDNPGVGWFTFDLTSATNLRITRGLTGSATADVGWSVVEFNQAGFTVTESGGSTQVDESGTTDTFTVVLDAPPNSNVVFNVSSGDVGEATVSPASLTFTSANWNTAQTVTVTGADDNIIDGSQNTTLTVSVDDANSDDYFDPLANQTVSATTTDDDVAGFTIVESGGSTSVAESGTTDTFTVVLDAEPDSNVVILVSSGDTGEATVNVASLTFIPAVWNTAQTVMVTGVDDNLIDGNQNTTITLSIDDVNSDDNFDPLANQTVSATTTDDDVAGFTIVESGGSTSVAESGTTDTFTVVLDAEPDSNVVILVSSEDTGEATVNVSSLTFIPAAWNTAQTVTVTGVDDNLIDGNQNTDVTLSIDDANSDDNFDPLANQRVTATTTDDDVAGFTIVESGGSTSVAESGTTDTFTVVLDAEPDSNVVILVSSGDTGEATVNVSSLTFIPAAWNTAQTVTVTGVDDNLIDGNQNATITLSIDDANSDDNFDPLANQTVSATTTDDDVAGFTIVESSGSTSVAESGTTDTFTVVLDAEPDSNVVILVSSGDTGEATVNVSSLSFIPAAWNTAQTVTVTGVDDNLIDGSQNTTITLSIDDANSDDNFDPLANQTVSATTTDDDVAGFTIVESGGSTSVSESGTTDIFTVVLDAEPDSNVVILVSSGETGEATVNVSSLTFIPAAWNTAQTVTVTGVDDNLIDGNQNATITLSIDDANSDDNFDPLANQTVSATTTDDDVAGFTIVESSGSTSVAESGTTDTFTVVLDAEPDSNVVILVSCGDTGEATVNVASLTFIPASWNTAQTVTVTGVDDNLIDGNQNTTITLSVDDANSDDNFDPLANQTVSATTTDDDVAGFTIVESSGSTSVAESGTTDTFTVVLNAEPDSNVVILVSSGDTGEATVNVSSLTFIPASWNTAQTVTVTGVDDNLIDGNQNTTITLSIDDANSDDNFDPLANQTVSATTTDDDVAGFTIVESGGSTSVSESGTTDTFTVVLDAEPDSNVVILVSSGDTGEATVNVASLTFFPASWNTAQTVTVTGVDDDLDDGDQSTLITLSIDDVNSDDTFDPLPDQTVSATTVDDDASGFTIVESGGTSINESGTTDTFTAVLDAEPTSNVVILVSSADTGEATVDVSLLTFTPANWDTAQTVTVTGVDDDLDDGDQSTLITLSIDDINSDDTFDPLPDQTVSATTVDDDVSGFTLVESGGSTSVNESGTTDTFTAVLDAEPTSNVVILVSSADTGEATVDVSLLTFTPANWDTAQTVTVTGVDDDLDDGDQSTLITLSIDDINSDDTFDPLPDQTVSATTVDDDASGFTIVESGGTSVNESGTTDTFTAVLDAEPVSNVVILVSSADTGEATVNVASLTFTPANWDTAQTVTVTGVDDDLDDGDQNTLITLSIDDANSDDTFDPLADQTVSATTVDDDASGFSIVESSGSTSVNESGTTDTFTAVLDAEPTSNVVILVSSADTGEATVDVSLLTFTPANWDTAQTVTVTGVDDDLDDGDQNTLITLSIDDINSDDTFDPLPDQTVSATTVDDDASGFTVVESSGSTSVNESGTTDTFTAVLDAEPTSNVVILVSSADTGEATVDVSLLTFTPANWDTAQTVTVTGVDDDLDDGDQNTLITLSIDDINSDDTFDPLPDQTVSATTVDDDASGFTIVESGGTSVNESGTTDTFTAVLDAEPTSNVVILVSSADTGEATVDVSLLTFTPANWDTAQTVTVTGVDDDLDDGDQSTLITLSIDDINSDDTFDPLSDQTVSATTVDDDASGFTIVESGGTSVNESGTTDTFTAVLDAEPTSNVVILVSSADTGEATVDVSLLTFTPADWDTAQTVTVTGVDDDLDDGDQSTLITLSIDDINSDDTFDPLPDQTVNATTVDDDASGFTIVESGGTSVNESGTTDIFTAVLDAEPTSNVVILVSSADTGEATVNVASLTFTPANWDTAQTVTVTGVDDDLDDGDQNTLITLSIDDANSDDTFDPLPDQTVSATTVDDDASGFTIVESGGTSVNESGTTDTFTAVLDAEPTSNVVILVSSADTGEATVDVSLLTFTPANWDTAQTVTVTGVDDDLDDGDQSTLITLSIDDANSDDTFDPLPDQTVSATTVDDDASGFTIVESGGTSVNESGTTDTFTAVLDAEPTSNVVILVSSADTGEATVNVASLTFTPANWDTAQTVTVTGVDDDLDDGDQSTLITLSIDDANSDDTFDPLADQTVSATTVDDDVSGFTIIESGGTSVNESGTTDTFTAVLDAEPVTNVVILVSSADTGEATVNVASLTFTPANWDTAQTVTVTGVDDDLDDGDQNTLITLSIDDANSDDTFDPLADQTVSATTVDDDASGFNIVESSGSTSVNESGTTDTFTAVLDAEPTSNVVILVSSADTGEATVDVSLLTFTPANWDTAQTVTVTGVDDDLDDGDQNTLITLLIDDINSDDTFDPLPDQTVNATTVDDDASGFMIVESGGTSVNESGTTDTFTVVLDAEPTSNVVILVSSADTGEATVDVSLLTFTPANWDTTQTVTVTGVDDDLDDGDQSTLITLSIDDINSDDTFDPLPDQTVNATTVDDDASGFTIVESGGTSVNESGTTDTFTAVLDAEPISNVVILVSSADTGEATVDVSLLTFTPANWDTAQTVTVTGVDDDLDDGDQSTLITLSIDDINSDDTFDPLPDQTVNATTVDDDASGFTIVESGGTSVNESGTTDTFTAVLDAEPTSNVVILVSSADTGEATVDVSLLTFTPADWDTAQTVTVTGVDDDLDDGDQSTLITLSIDDVNSDDTFDPLPDQTVNATTVDDDASGFTIVESGGTSVNESGTTDTFTVVLDAEPTSNVVILVSSADTGEATVDVSLLTFTPANWDTAQTVTVTGVDDDLDDGDQNTLITLSIDDINSDDTFDPLPDQTVSATTVDDDASGFTIVESGGTSVNESGTTDTFTVVLDAEPTSNVVITTTSADTGEATVNVSSLTFTPANWDTAQTVTVTGVDDDLDDGDQNTLITLSIDDINSDDTFDPLPDQTVSATTVDDDASGFTIVESGGTSVNESGTTDTFTAVLDAEPTSNVVILVSSADTGEATVDVSLLTFTPANWDTAQTVTVTGVDDDLDDGDQSTLITLSIDDINSDDTFDPLPDQTVNATTVDDDASGFTIAESGGSTSVNESGTTDIFTAVLTAEPATNVVILVSSADTGEATVDLSLLTFTPANWDTVQTVTVTGVDDDLDDGDQNTLITLSIDDINSDDTFDPLPDQTVSATTVDDDASGFTVVESLGSTSVDESGTTDTFTAVLNAEPTSNVVILVSSADTGEATVDVSLLTFTPANWDTAQTVTVTGVDDDLDDGDQSTLITLSIDDANSDDSFDPLPDQTVNATTVDDDTAGFTVLESGGSTSVDESGTTDIFTAVLTAEPATNVVILVSSADTGEATVELSLLTFTPANWDTVQTVTVTGVDDDLDDGDQNTLITLSIDDLNSDDTFDPLPDQSISATTVDDDTAGFAVVESSGSTSVNESGTTDIFTAVLTAEPATNVVILVSSADTGEATVDLLLLTFTPANWDTVQTVTVTGVDDDLDDGDQSTLITLSIDDLNSDDTFDPLPDQTVSATTVDDDTAGFTVVESSGSTSVNESGTTDSFAVVLTAEPATNVVILVSSADTGEATVDLSLLTFTPANWDTAQTVTVTGVDDDLDDGDQNTLITLSIDDANSDDTFDPLPDQTVNATTVDDDASGFTVMESGGSTSVNESGTTDTFTAVLTAEPATNVVILVSSADTGEATVDLSLLTFTPANWDTAQTVTVTGVDDDLDDGDQSTLITLSIDDLNSDDTFDPLPDQTVSVTTTDDDAAGFTVLETAGSTSVSESGTTDTFTVVLTAEPASNVVIQVSSADTGEATVDQATLTFAPGNWNTPQVVTVTGVDDDLVDGDQTTLVTLSIDDANSDDTFDPLADQTVSATTTDDDAAGFTVLETAGSTSVSESGTTDTFTVVLTAEPASNVVIQVSSADTGEATVDQATLTFTPGNWNTSQVVTVTGVDDDLVDGDQSTLITLSIDDANSDDTFDPLANQTVSVTTTDDDAAGFTVLETAGSTSVSESGTTDTFTVVLTAEPASNVVIQVSSADTGEATVDQATLTFAPGNWSTPQVVTITGVDDDLVDGDQTTLVTLSIDDANSDDSFDPLADQTVSVTTTDDDAAGFTVLETAGSTSVSESGTTDTFSVVLTAEPASNVVIQVSSADTGEATVDQATLTFAPGNWSTPQVVTVTGVDDDLVDGDQSTLITLSIDDANSDDSFDPLADQTVSVTTTDDDAAGFTVLETAGSTSVSESGTTDTLTVVLTAEPASNVVLLVSSADTGEATVDQATLTFTPGNWNAPQVVTVTGVDDDLVDGDQSTLITLSIDDANSDDSFDPLADQTVSVTTTDDDAAGFTVLETAGSTSVSESGTMDTFSVVLTAEPVSNVVILVGSADTGEATVDQATLTFAPGNWSTPQAVTVTGVDDDLVDGDQTTLVTLSIDDANSDDSFDPLADQTVSVTTTDDDAADFTVLETGGSTSVSEFGTTDTFSVVLTAEPASNVVIQVSSADTGEATVDQATLTFAPGNWSAPQVVTVTGVDDDLVDGDQTTLITLSVDDANSDDTFDPLANQTVSVTTTDDDAAGFTVLETAGSTSVSESGTTDTFTVVLAAEPASNVVIQVGSADTGEATVDQATLTFTPGNWNAPQVVTVTGVDDDLVDGDQSTLITLSIDDANSDDSFDPLADQTVSVATTDDDAAGLTVLETAGSTSVDESGTTDTFTVVLTAEPASNVVILVSSADTGEATVDQATLTFAPGNWNTPQVVTVTGVDDDLVDGDQNTIITLAVDDANSDDSFDLLADQTVSATTTDDDAAGFTVVESGGSTSVNESGTTDTFTVVLTAEPVSNVVILVIHSALSNCA